MHEIMAGYLGKDLALLFQLLPLLNTKLLLTLICARGIPALQFIPSSIIAYGVEKPVADT